MESLLNRYRNITVLLLVIMAQLVLLAVSAKNDQDVRMIRVWTVTAVTPLARIIEGVRGGGSGFLHNYVLLHDTSAENKKLQAEVDKLRLENTFLKNELNTAERAKALQVFQAHSPSKMLGATIFGIGAGSNAKVVLADRGTVNGVQRGMAVVTPDGIVGKVVAAYPMASQVQLITDPEFAAGVMTKGGARGTLKGQGTPQCRIDYVPFEDKVDVGEWVYTSGDDRIFPRGFAVGQVRSVRAAQPFKEVMVEPSGLQRGLEDVLIIVEGVHQDIPDTPPGLQPVYLAPPPPGAAPNSVQPVQPGNPGGTEADRLESAYKALGQAQGHDFGDNRPGEKPPDYTKLGQPAAPPAPKADGAVPPATGAPPKNPPPDAVRRSNQAGGGPGGQVP
ncbi:MAG TPA: rod shape-determining protein MreC [Candidatus Acidoferrales bacterium]|nr:rod shape-determining protein MreC [Candidatus Acidoferrales bacterium]